MSHQQAIVYVGFMVMVCGRGPEEKKTVRKVQAHDNEEIEKVWHVSQDTVKSKIRGKDFLIFVQVTWFMKKARELIERSLQ